jgi:uncharacterized protein YqeY
MIRDNIQKQINEAMKARDEIRVMTLRMLSAALTNAEIDNKRVKLTEEQEITVVKKEAKKRKDAIEIYDRVGEKVRADKERRELEILKEFLPEEMGEEEIEKIAGKVIGETGASGMENMGKVIGMVMKETGGKADGGIVAKVVKEKLT